MGVSRYLFSVAASLLALAAIAQPRQAVTIVVPFPKGGGAEFVARELARVLPAALGEPVVLRERAGDDGLVAADEVAQAPADGYTLLLGSLSSLVLAPLAHGRPPLDPTQDFQPVALVASVPRIVLVHPSLPAANLDQLIRLARENPARLACGTSDQLSQLAVRLFERQAGVKLDCTHYAGGAALRDDLVAGRRKVAFESFVLPEVRAGELRALAIAAPYRMRALPDVPTTSESGLPGVEAVAWSVLLAPRATPGERVEKLVNATSVALRQPAFVAALEARGYVIRPATPLQMRQYLQRELGQWKRAS